MVNEMQGKEVGAIRARKGALINGFNTTDLHLVVLVDRKNSSMMLTIWSSVTRNRYTNKRRVVSELVEFKCSEEQMNLLLYQTCIR